mmetsp:Transcript_92709/g.267715  ORF Transcript_92709/g.267715 Transcript_92709/m.267715 type:complete len:908 (+) Transcript_92709:163-2886(+)
MKRALAERAKQSGLPNGVGPSVPESADPPSQPQQASSSSAEANGGPTKALPSAPLNNTSSPRPKKRLRESIVKLEEEDEDDSNANAFYLRHQNRALASELRQLKYQLTRLERERDVRRTQCTRAVQGLNTLQATWTQLEETLQNGQAPTSTGEKLPEGTSSAPLSTGSGKSVEMMGALFNSLAALGNGAKRIKNEMDVDGESDQEDPHLPEPLPQDDDAEDEAAQKEQLDLLMVITNNVAKRASTLQGCIFSLLHRLENGTADGVNMAEQLKAAQQQISRLKAKNKTLKAQIEEIARTRDEYQESDKRVRRGLYRLASNRVQLKEVLKAIVSSDEDKEAAAEWMAYAGQPPAEATAAAPVAASKKIEGDAKSSVSSEELASLQKKISDLEQVASARDAQIKTLLSEKEEQTKKISNLVLSNNGKSTGTLTDDDIKKSDLYAEVSAKLLGAERSMKEMKEKEERLRIEWGQSLATAEAAQKEIEDLKAKHVKCWTDLVEEFPDLESGGEEKTNGSDAAEGKTDESESDMKAKEIAVLKHKLTQALENVRQAEGTRKTLQEAVLLNNSLQSKLDEVKAKYNSLQQRQADNAENNDGGDEIGGLVTPKPKPSSASSSSVEKPDKSDKSSEKLHREYRRLQKQLAAATASKESAKSKLERAEKDRESLSGANSRLLRQAAEKDEMNAKSLSTILHLKQLTDQITKEKENLEQQVKSSQQLALSARLAANARERLTEEIEKEREAMRANVKEWEDKCKALAQEKDQIEAKMAQNRSRMAGLLKEVEGAKSRCEELASESTKLQEEKQTLTESLMIARKETEEAKRVTEQLSQSSGGSIVAGFTAEQLHTQVKHLQSRVNCPVCNVRDKKCILLRCRHMFCKNCVDENIKNRSRKCPACGIRFDTKDVGDIWL